MTKLHISSVYIFNIVYNPTLFSINLPLAEWNFLTLLPSDAQGILLCLSLTVRLQLRMILYTLQLYLQETHDI